MKHHGAIVQLLCRALLWLPDQGRGIWWSFLKAMKVRHHTRPSVLTHLAYHNQGATALMFAILTGKFEAARVLVEAGARLDLKNDRGKTAVDLLDEMHAPYILGNDTMVKVASIATTTSAALPNAGLHKLPRDCSGHMQHIAGRPSGNDFAGFELLLYVFAVAVVSDFPCKKTVPQLYIKQVASNISSCDGC